MSSIPFRRVAVSALVTAVAATAAAFIPTSGASAESVPGTEPVPAWATEALSVIHPGIATTTDESASCTSNFVFTDAAGHAYLGQAAHCSGLGAPNDTNGCLTDTMPLGTPVELGASGVTGTIAYSSWNAMQAVGEKDPNACAHNDFALIRIPDKALGKVNPSVPVFGGPTGMRTSPLSGGEAVLSYGNSPLRAGLSVLSPKQGFTVNTSGGGWTHLIYTATPGVPGDSGSGYIDTKGQAFGVLSTLALAPFPASNGVSDLSKMLEYAQQHSGIKGLRLAKGTEDFVPGALPVLSGVIQN